MMVPVWTLDALQRRSPKQAYTLRAATAGMCCSLQAKLRKPRGSAYPVNDRNIVAITMMRAVYTGVQTTSFGFVLDPAG